MITCPNCKSNMRCEECNLICKCGWAAETRDGLRTHIKYENEKDKEKRYPRFIRSLSYTIVEVFTDIEDSISNILNEKENEAEPIITEKGKEKILIEDKVEPIITEKGKEKIFIEDENDSVEPITKEEQNILFELEKALREKEIFIEAEDELSIIENEAEPIITEKGKEKILIEDENELASTLEVINKEAEDGSTESRATL